MSISIIIPNYNGQGLLKKNLPKVAEAVSSYKDGSVEITVVDDCSTDNSIEILEKMMVTNEALKIIKNEKNLGFSSTVNRGVMQSKGEITVLLNTDVIPEKEFLSPLVEHFKEEKVFAVGCMDKSIENGKTILRGRGIGVWQRGFFIHRRGEVNKTNTLWVNGGSGAFRKSIWDILGGLDELYNPFYWEDIDLSYRAIKSGYKILFEPKSIVRHEHEKGAIKSSYSTAQIKTIAYRNQFIFVWKNATDLTLQFWHVFWLPYYIVKALVRKDWVFLIGFFQALILFPKIIQSSFKAQRLFIKSDSEITKNFLE